MLSVACKWVVLSVPSFIHICPLALIQTSYRTGCTGFDYMVNFYKFFSKLDDLSSFLYKSLFFCFQFWIFTAYDFCSAQCIMMFFGLSPQLHCAEALKLRTKSIPLHIYHRYVSTHQKLCNCLDDCEQCGKLHISLNIKGSRCIDVMKRFRTGCSINILENQYEYVRKNYRKEIDQA